MSLHKPFAYSLRVSRKAKYAKLKIKPFGGLEVVIPLRFPKKAVPGLLEQHAKWIQRQLKKQPDLSREPVLPDKIHLAINGYRTEVVYGIGNAIDFALDEVVKMIGSSAREVVAAIG